MDYTTASGYVVDAKGRRQFQDRDLPNGVKGTSLIAVDHNAVMNALMYLIQEVQMVPNPNDDSQVWAAVEAMIKAALIGSGGSLDFMPVQQGGALNQTTDKITLGQDATYKGLLRLSVAGVDRGNLLSGTYLATIDGTNGDLPGLGMWFQKTTGRPAFTYQDATGAPKIIALPNQEDVQAVQSSIAAEQATRADQVAVLTVDVSNRVSGVYGKSSSDYQILGFYQQISTGRPVVVFNNGTAVVYNGVANIIDVTTLQTNLTSFQTQQADQNSTFASNIAARIPTNATNDGTNAPITLMNFFLKTGMLWFSANGSQSNVAQTNPGTGWNAIKNITVENDDGALTVLDTTGKTNTYAPCSSGTIAASGKLLGGYWTKTGNVLRQVFKYTANFGDFITFPTPYTQTPVVDITAAALGGMSTTANIEGDTELNGFTFISSVYAGNPNRLENSGENTISVTVEGWVG